MITDICLGIAWGDEGKGKCVSYLLSKKTLFGRPYYDYCMRYSGGHNCGHTIIHNGKKMITHIIPAGVFHNIPCIIGCGCVLNPEKFFKEIEYLEENGIKCRHLIKIAYNTHIITQAHIEEDTQNEGNSLTAVGSTKQGNMPAYRDKVARVGIRAENINELKPFIVDPYDLLFKDFKRVLMEGAQGFNLCVDAGAKYPYVTSSNCGIGAAVSNGIPPQSIRKVYGILKAYSTYVGADKFQPDGEIYKELQRVGKEFGATTGRPRQTNWLDINLLKRACDMNGITHLVVNKMDILQEIGVWNMIKDGQIVELKTEKNFKRFLEAEIDPLIKIIYSYRPDRI